MISESYAERLRRMATGIFDRALCYAAADAIERFEYEQDKALAHEDGQRTAIAVITKRAERAELDNQRMRIALEPFAKMAHELENEPAWSGVLEHDHPLAGHVTVADFRAAHSALYVRLSSECVGNRP